MEYLDSSVFIYAFLDQEERGEKCRTKLKNLQEGKESAVTSTLTFDEVFWKVKRGRGLAVALEVAETVLRLPHLTFIDVTSEIIWHALALIKEYQLDPRDAIHAACALSQGITIIISEDEDFEVITELERKFV